MVIAMASPSLLWPGSRLSEPRSWAQSPRQAMRSLTCRRAAAIERQALANYPEYADYRDVASMERWRVFGAVPINLPAYGYTEDEYYLSGTANAYQVVPDSNYKTTVIDSGPYTTNIVI